MNDDFTYRIDLDIEDLEILDSINKNTILKRKDIIKASIRLLNRIVKEKQAVGLIDNENYMIRPLKLDYINNYDKELKEFWMIYFHYKRTCNIITYMAFCCMTILLSISIYFR